MREAQAKGYAEADPSLDVDGHDAAHKLVVLAMLAFGARVDADRGADRRDPRHRAHRPPLRRALRLTPSSTWPSGATTARRVELRVHPALVRRDTPLANVNGVLNAIALEGRALGPCLLSGRGAGDMPTAVSVVADVLDVAARAPQRLRRHGDPRHPDAGAPAHAPRRRADALLPALPGARPAGRARAPRGRARRGRRVDRADGAGGRGGLERRAGRHRHADARRAERDVRRALGVIAAGEMSASAPRLLRIQE